uniref:Uncharacterized protein n=1 Tax=Chrysodeixis includens nucleopolyhedrovirus TaxID=1207438 RepID=A0A1C8ZZ72_9ABAC|nr:hypothetical protein [Chrysodeixis includens nucleopolyhedrovirus]
MSSEQQELNFSFIEEDFNEVLRSNPELKSKFLSFERLHHNLKKIYDCHSSFKRPEDLEENKEIYERNLINRGIYIDCLIKHMLSCMEKISDTNIITEVILNAAKAPANKFNMSIDYAMWTMAEILVLEKTGKFDIIPILNLNQDQLGDHETYFFDTDNVKNDYLENYFHYVTCWIPDNVNTDDDEDKFYIEIDVKARRNALKKIKLPRSLVNEYKSFVVTSPMDEDTYPKVLKQLQCVLKTILKIPTDEMIKKIIKIAKIETFDYEDIKYAHHKWCYMVTIYADHFSSLRSSDTPDSDDCPDSDYCPDSDDCFDSYYCPDSYYCFDSDDCPDPWDNM